MLARFEQLVEQAVEGGLRRVFPTQLQPVQLAKAAARAMEEAQVVGLHGTNEVPNVYILRLAPPDLTRFAEYSGTLSRELSRYLADYARERRLRPVGAPRVELAEDTSVPVGSVRTEARFVDVEPERRAELEEALEGTRRLRLADLASARPTPTAPEAQVWLTDRFGTRFPLDSTVGIVRIGRALDNDVSISNQRISRYHAQLRWVESAWLVYDLDSTNGTFIDGERVFPSQPRPLRAGASLRLGDHELAVGEQPGH